MILSDGKDYINMGGGVLVERDAFEIAKRIKEYDSDLELICLDPADPNVKVTSAPFMVVWRNPSGIYEKVLEAWQLDARILERLWSADQQKTDQLHTLEQWEAQLRKKNESRYREEMDNNGEMLAAAMKNPKSSFTFHKDDDLVKINDVGPVTRNREKKSF